MNRSGDEDERTPTLNRNPSAWRKFWRDGHEGFVVCAFEYDRSDRHFVPLAGEWHHTLLSEHPVEARERQR